MTERSQAAPRASAALLNALVEIVRDEGRRTPHGAGAFKVWAACDKIEERIKILFQEEVAIDAR